MYPMRSYVDPDKAAGGGVEGIRAEGCCSIGSVDNKVSRARAAGGSPLRGNDDDSG